MAGRFLASLVLASGAAAAQQAADPTAIGKRVAPCMACHGKEGRAARDGYYPRIAGKPAGYLHHQLLNFRDGRRRQYPLMAYMVQHLSDAYLEEMANYFAAQEVPYPPPPTLDVSPTVLEKGRALAMSGDASRKIPACVACHGKALTGVAPFIPGLLGIPRDYINAQFGAWRSGARRAMAPDCMGQIARQLSPEDISAVSAWLATRQVPAKAAPALALPAPLPVACGSVPEAR
ncbi:cytochrome C553 [Noviherbaspirillum autotrophicum]|uniref:Cytochrome C553 n=1 Tax=Noviherbaspirillum autotrophicum TaxID=709839 RepID=A0A0C2C0Z1_9BURK|nr:cytochrome C553 [Noviherbaspirillum autotrophicum]